MKEKSNIIQGLHPLSKIWILPIVILEALLFKSYMLNFILFIIMLAISIWSSCAKSLMKVIAKSILILCVTIFLMQILFFHRGGDIYFTLGMFPITHDGLINALQMSTNLLAIGTAFLLFFQITSITDFINALEDAGLNQKVCFIVSSTLQMIPQLKQQSLVIMDAQKSRGIEVEGKLSTRMKTFIPTLGPLVLASIASTEERAITLECRGFSAECKKTKLHSMRKQPGEKYIKYASVAIMGICIILKIYFVIG